MPNVREIRNRIKSVKNIGQVTRALEAVSASRARKAQQQALASRNYAQKAWEVLVNVASQGGNTALQHPLLAKRDEVKQVTILLLSGDRGLAGAYNANILRVALTFARQLCTEENCSVRWVVAGRKGRDALLRSRQNVIAEFSNLPADLTIQTVGPIAR
ncbi:MAG: F0F1 ATP synthase subunit gamma, partial [Anaerolineae bacterium]|nr:F0F1 ATP synthase subunit gamma [Anaerolineae bacterium]